MKLRHWQVSRIEAFDVRIELRPQASLLVTRIGAGHSDIQIWLRSTAVVAVCCRRRRHACNNSCTITKTKKRRTVCKVAKKQAEQVYVFVRSCLPSWSKSFANWMLDRSNCKTCFVPVRDRLNRSLTVVVTQNVHRGRLVSTERVTEANRPREEEEEWQTTTAAMRQFPHTHTHSSHATTLIEL